MRSKSIDLYRVLAMFGICLLHVIVQGGYLRSRGLDNLLMPSVVAFVFISGYFGVRFSWRKIIRLISLGVYCSLVVALLYHWRWGDRAVFEMTLRILKYYWFLWAYLILMCFAPLVEISIEQGGRKLLPILMIVFCWSFALRVPCIREWIPSSAGLTPLSSLTLLGIYVAAGLCRYYEIDKRFSWPLWAGMAIVSGVAVWFGFCHYNSIAALIFAGALFYLIKPYKVPPTMAWILNLITPSVFSVYLLHCNGVGFRVIHAMNRYMLEDVGIPLYGTYFLTAIIVFLGCLIIDIPRRFVVFFVCKSKFGVAVRKIRCFNI